MDGDAADYVPRLYFLYLPFAPGTSLVAPTYIKEEITDSSNLRNYLPLSQANSKKIILSSPSRCPIYYMSDY